jgi:hypothetical protein
MTADRIAAAIGEHVLVTFVDGHVEAGILAAIRPTEIDVEHTYGDSPFGAPYGYTATYALTAAEEDCPPVESVRPDIEQQEALFA